MYGSDSQGSEKKYFRGFRALIARVSRAEEKGDVPDPAPDEQHLPRPTNS